MEYYKLWDTPLKGEAWTLFRTLQSEGALQDFTRFSERVPRSSHEYVLFDRVCCSFEQVGVLMKHGLMHSTCTSTPGLALREHGIAPTSRSKAFVTNSTARSCTRTLSGWQKRGEEWHATHAVQ
jgi:hypothetical protein